MSSDREQLSDHSTPAWSIDTVLGKPKTPEEWVATADWWIRELGDALPEAESLFKALVAAVKERNLAGQDADRRSCQGGWNLAQERASKALEAEWEAARLRAELAMVRENEARMQEAGLRLGAENEQQAERIASLMLEEPSKTAGLYAAIDELQRENEAPKLSWGIDADHRDEAQRLARENERLRKALRELRGHSAGDPIRIENIIEEALESRGASDEPQAPTPRYEIVKMFSGMWNVREASSGEWHKPGVGLSKVAAQTMADDLNSSLPSREQEAN